MGIDERLLEILACPNCHGEVTYIEAESVIVCEGECRYRYPVRDGIPVMLIDEAEKPEGGAGSAGPQGKGGAGSAGPQGKGSS